MDKYKNKGTVFSYSELLGCLKSTFFLSGVVLALFVWILNPSIYAVFQNQGTIYQQLNQPDIHIIFMRSAISATIIIFSFIGSVLLNRSRQTEKALYAANEEWEMSFDALPEHICILDMSGTILRANKIMRERFEAIHGELRGLDYRLIYCGTATPDPQPPCAAVLSGSPAVMEESELPAIDGWFIVSSFPLFNEEKEQIGAVSVVTDITDRKQTERNLDNRTNRLLHKQKVLFELSKEDFPDQETAFNLIIKADAEQLKVERVSVWLYNKERTGLICKALYQQGEIGNEQLIMIADDYPRYFLALEEYGYISANDARNDPSTNEFNEIYLKPLGITSMMDVPILLQGKMVGIVCHEHIGPARKWTVEDEDFANSISDLCALVLAAAKRKQAEESFSHTASLLKNVINTSQDLIFVKDTQLRTILCNDFFAQAVDKKPEELYGRTDIENGWSIELVKGNPERGIRGFEADDREVLAGQTIRIDSEPVNVKDEIRYFNTIKTPLTDATGKIIGVLGIARDITEHKHKEEDRIKLEQQLAQSQKMEAVGQLTEGIAHDFKNILAAVLGFSHLARDRIKGRDDEKLEKYLNEVIKGGDRASKLVDEMLIFGRAGVEAAKAISVNDIVMDTMKLLKGMLPSSIEILLYIGEDIPPVLIDPIQLEQMLMNLCINARDAMHEVGTLTIDVQNLAIGADQTEIPSVFPDTKGERIDVCFCQKESPLFHTGDYVELSVMDTGSGVSNEELGHIFEPFYTTKEVGKGTGMGLAMVHGIMQGAKGHIVVETEEDKGMLFPVTVQGV